MASDWLELDAADDWVRHDAEIVRPIPSHSHQREAKIHINHILGATTGASICIISKYPNSHPSFSM